MTNFFAAGIDVTNKCTLRCLHCFNSSGGLKNQRMDEMSDEELERMAYDVIDCSRKSLEKLISHFLILRKKQRGWTILLEI